MKNRNFKDSITEPQNLLQIILEAIYIIVISTYLINLNNFNKLMLAKGLTAELNKSGSVTAASKILGEGGSKYLIGAVLWIASGIGLIVVFYKVGKTSSYPTIGTFIKLFHILVYILFLVILWQLINNPIVRAFLVIIGFGTLVVATTTSN